MRKDDFICNQIDGNGFVSQTQGSFDQAQGNSPLRRLYEYYWRNLTRQMGICNFCSFLGIGE
jgi:hypothetical protein